MKNSRLILALILITAGTAVFWFLAGPAARPENEPAPAVSQSEIAVATKVIDGDTIIVSGGDHVRLLGIDSDEKGYPCYDAARMRLEQIVLGKTVTLERDNEDLDQYGRKLRYIFADGKNISEILVAEGLAVARFYPENQKYKKEIVAAEAKAIENKIGCKWGGQPQSEANGTMTNPAPDPENNEQKISGDAIAPCEAKNNIGNDVVVEGPVADAYRSGGGTVFLNFGGAYPNNCFTAVIFKSDLANFSNTPETEYGGKIVRVRGVVEEYQGKPEIILRNESQIKTID